MNERNQHLLNQINEALLKKNTVVVPWGLMHLPEIENRIKNRGSARSEEIRIASSHSTSFLDFSFIIESCPESFFYVDF